MKKGFTLIEVLVCVAIVVIGVIMILPLVVGGFSTSGSSGANGQFQQQMSHMKSQFAGLDREITLYSNDGKVIERWQTRTQVEDKGGSFRFMVGDRAVIISGTVVIKEIDQKGEKQ